jgi:adenylylsulfate kinase
VITIAAFISPTNEIRKLAKSIIGEEDFIEIFVNPPLEVCEQRDTKGLYKKARKGEIQNFTGISAPFEAPENPDLVIDTSMVGVEESLRMVMEVLEKDIQYK